MIFTAGRRRKRRARVLLAVLSLTALGIAVGAWRLWGWEGAPVAGATARAEEPEIVERAVTVELEDGGSTHPKRVRVPIGSRMQLTVVNGSTAAHDLIVQELDLHVDTDPGTRGSDSVLLTASGSFRSLCIRDGHAESVTFLVS